MVKKRKKIIKLQYINSYSKPENKMKKIVVLVAVMAFIVACNTNKNTEKPIEETTEAEMAYQSFGAPISDENIMSREELEEKYKSLQPGDSVRVKFKSEVKEVCQNKGCWMKMDMGSEDVMVRFKDYGFFVPKNIAGQEIIVEGYAFVEEMSVDDQKHFAEDAGESPEEISKIITPKRTLSFVSSGVLIPEMESPIENK